MSIISNIASAYVLYAIIKRLTWDYTQWPAYKTGVIDDKGNILIKKNNRTLEQQDSFALVDVMCLNMKKLLSKIPGGNNRFVTYGAALYLLKEEKINEQKFKNFLLELNYNDFKQYLKEEKRILN